MTAEFFFLNILAEFAEMALYGDPCAFRGDAHLLVVVTDRSAGGERIAQPEAVFGADAIGDIGERRRSFIRRDNKVRIVLIPADHLRRRLHGFAIEIVGDVEQAAQECLVSFDRRRRDMWPRRAPASASERSRPWRRPAR